MNGLGVVEAMFSFLRTYLSMITPAAVGGGIQVVAASTKTVDNRQAACHEESNANARYLAFAARADEEGYGEVASLCRTAAKEEIQAHNHATVLKKWVQFRFWRSKPWR